MIAEFKEKLNENSKIIQEKNEKFLKEIDS
jgi:hypothetical protein